MKKISLLIIAILFLSLIGCTGSTSNQKNKVLFLGLDDKLISTIYVDDNENFEYPKAPSVEGYEFVEWDLKLFQVTKDTTIRAIYKKNIYKVNFYDFNNNIIKTEEVEYGQNLEYPELSIIDGYEFNGWDKEVTNITSNLDVKPIYKKTKFNVKFYDDNGTLINEQEISYGKNAIEPDIPLKEGYTFIGWDKEINNITSDLEVRPIYNKTKFSVKFYNDNDTIISEQEISYGENAIEPDTPLKQGYTFVGWDKEFNNVTSNLEVRPRYEAIYYNVTFIDKYGEIIETKSVQAYTKIEAPKAPVVDFHTFDKWSENLDEVTEDLTVQAIYKKNTETYDINNVNYWLREMASKYDINKPLLENDKINSFNDLVVSDYSKTKVVDVTKEPITRTYSYVYGLITNYSNINKYTIYNETSGSAISSTEKTNILNNRNLDNISDTVNVKFGIITDFAWVRSYPTNHYSSNYSMDRFQETSLNVGEGVAIYHESLDGNWYFVQAQNYNGWVEKENIATCSKEELDKFLKNENRLVVISDYQIIETAYVRMGQSFPLIESNETNHKVSFPIRNSSGVLELKEVTLANNGNYSKGYLEYTYKNVFLQAFKLLGIDYSWGDKNTDGRDCSSTMNAIYTCFGFMMPRNTSNQRSVPTYGGSVSGLTTTSLQKYKPGTMIFTSGHVMLYIGENASGTSYLLHNTTSGSGACILQSFASYGGSKMIGVLKMQ